MFLQDNLIGPGDWDWGAGPAVSGFRRIVRGDVAVLVQQRLLNTHVTIVGAPRDGPFSMDGYSQRDLRGGSDTAVVSR